MLRTLSRAEIPGGEAEGKDKETYQNNKTTN